MPRPKPDSWECRVAGPRDWRAMLSCWYGLDQHSLEIDSYYRRLLDAPGTAKHCWLAVQQQTIDAVAWLLPHSPSLFHCWPVRSRYEHQTSRHFACTSSLWKSVNSYLDSLDVKQCQALISTSAHDDLSTMKALGFSRVAFIHRMSINLQEFNNSEKSSSAYLVKVQEDNWHLFQKCFQSTMVDSLDVPELNALQSGEQVGSQYLDPSITKYLVMNNGHQAVGVAVLETDDAIGVLRYLGINPEFRQQGIATQAMQLLLEQLKSISCQMVEVRLDARNLPARKLYDHMGFVHHDDEELLIAL